MVSFSEKSLCAYSGSKVSASGIWIFEIEIFYTILRVKYSITYEASYVNGMSNI